MEINPFNRKPSVHDDTIGQKILREAELVESVGQGFAQAAKEAFKPEHLPETVGKVAASALLGVVVGRNSVTSGFRGVLSRSAMVGSGLSFADDILGKGCKLAGAIQDTWRSPAHRDADRLVSEILGKFAFDTALMTAGGLAISRVRWHSRSDASEFAVKIHYHELDVPPPAIPAPDALHSRLVSSRMLSETLLVPVENATRPFADYADFLARGVKEVHTPIREYTVSGLKTKIVVPEPYAQQLDQVRALRLASEKPGLLNYWVRKNAASKLNTAVHSERALPEEFIPFLEHTPDPTRVKRLLVLDSEYAYGALYERDPHFNWGGGASANKAGDVRFHKKPSFWTEDDIATTNHEWSHIIGFNNETASKAFESAAQIEGTDFVLSAHALHNNHENWAIHMGNGLLAAGKGPFLETVENAPMRSSVLARSLADVLHEVPEAERSAVHQKYLNRVKYIQEHVVADVIAGLDQRIACGDTMAAQARIVRDYIAAAR